MHGFAIAAQAIGRDGLGLLTMDFGRPPPGGTRLAEILSPRPDPRAAAVDEEGVARATRP